MMKERQARGGAGRGGWGEVCTRGRAGRERTAAIWWECGAFLMGRSVPSDGIPSNVRVLAIPKMNALHATKDYITC